MAYYRDRDDMKLLDFSRMRNVPNDVKPSWSIAILAGLYKYRWVARADEKKTYRARMRDRPRKC